MSTAAKSSFYGWKLLFIFCLVFFVNVGLPSYEATIVNVYMARDLHLSRQMLGSIFSLFQLMVGLPSPFIAYCVLKQGVSRTMTVGSLLVLTGSLAMAFWVHTGWQAVIGFGLIVGLGAAAGGSLQNRGFLDRSPHRANASVEPDKDAYYFRLTPVFRMPIGPHDWLTRTVILGGGERHQKPDYTVFRYYVVL